MTYVCKSLTWWQTEVLVAELEWEPPLPEMVEYLLPAITVHRPRSLTVPIPMDVQTLTEKPLRDVFDLFMQRLTPLLTRLDTGLESREPVFIALISLASNVQSSLSTLDYPVYTTQWITE